MFVLCLQRELLEVFKVRNHDHLTLAPEPPSGWNRYSRFWENRVTVSVSVLDSQAIPAVHTGPLSQDFEVQGHCWLLFCYGLGSMAQGCQGTLVCPELSQIPTPLLGLTSRLARAHLAFLACSLVCKKQQTCHGLTCLLEGIPLWKPQSSQGSGP